MDYLVQNNTIGARSDTSVVILRKRKQCHHANEIRAVPDWNMQRALHSQHIHAHIEACTAIVKKRIFRESVRRKQQFCRNSADAVLLTNTIDQIGQVVRFTSPVAFGPSQTKARNCFVTFCGCWRLFFSLTASLSPPSVCVPHVLSQHAITQVSAWSNHPPPPRAVRKMYVYFARYTFGNTIPL